MAADGRLSLDKLSGSKAAQGNVPVWTGTRWSPGSGGLVIVDATAPSSPATGQLWLDLGTACGTAVPFTDDFNRADSTSTLGSGWSIYCRESVASTWGISSNKAYCVTDPLAPSSTYWDSLALRQVGYADIDMSVTVSGLSSSGSVESIMAWRVAVGDDDGNLGLGYFILYADGAGGVGDYAANAGLHTIAYGENFANGDVARVVTSGTSHTVYRNGVSIYSFTSSLNLTETAHGLASLAPSQVGTRFDDFSLAPSAGTSHPLMLWDGTNWLTVACVPPA